MLQWSKGKRREEEAKEVLLVGRDLDDQANYSQTAGASYPSHLLVNPEQTLVMTPSRKAWEGASFHMHHHAYETSGSTLSNQHV
jgi:hypothetical protein